MSATPNSSLARGSDHRYAVEDAHEIEPGSYTHILMAVYCGEPVRPGQYRMRSFQNFRGFPGALGGQPVCLCILPKGLAPVVANNLALRGHRQRQWLDVTAEWEIENGRRDAPAPIVPGAAIALSADDTNADVDDDGAQTDTQAGALTLAGLGITIKAADVPGLDWEPLKALAVILPGINASGKRAAMQAKVIAKLEELGA